MYELTSVSADNKKEFYKELSSMLAGLIGDETDWLANAANAASLLYHMLPEINWAGFYLYKNGQLVLGPFNGKPACVRIQMGKGVCGTAAQTGEIQVVEDANLFPGHIACDPASQSEIVLPIYQNGRLIGVLDIDSPVKGRFNSDDAEGLSAFIEILNQHIIWPEPD
jgi:L-methionine (R)-S-oxide reductase